MRKNTSTNALNEQALNDTCGMAYALGLIGGRWKPAILWRLLRNGRLRYSQLRQSLAGISERMLVLQLRELEEDGLVQRIVHPEVPSRVEYELTADGRAMQAMLESISAWGEQQRLKAVARSGQQQEPA
jgi:DNA-binding HxlR family transcriptional regulator